MQKKINAILAKNLINEQFPQWADLAIKEVKIQGWDNRTFRLGNDMLIRLPSAARYADKVEKEQQWLPKLAPHLTLQISKPIAMGKPSDKYPWHWSIYQWLPGTSANQVELDEKELSRIAHQLANFLHESQGVDTEYGPKPGEHNFYRGGNVAVYDIETKDAIQKCNDIIDAKTVAAVWQQALASTWQKDPVWIHGDLSSGNMLLNDENELTAIIDFGGMAIGDPTCDLVIAWTLLNDKSRALFKSKVNVDSQTWQRARGWALWKALITLAAIEKKTSDEAQKQLNIINTILDEHNIEQQAMLQNNIDACTQLWQLENLQQFENQSWNYTVHGYSNLHNANIVLKLCLNNDIYTQEKKTLSYFNGNGVVQLIDTSDMHDALLLEQLQPGITLKTLFPHNDAQATQIAAKLIKAMHDKPVEHNVQFQTVEQWLDKLRTCKNGSIPRSHLQKAQALAQQLISSESAQYVLHGDLHHENILQSNSSWKAIDPKGVIGELGYEVAMYMCNPIAKLSQQENIKDIIEQRLSIFAKMLEIDKQRIAQWSYVQAVLAACWASEDGVDSAPFIACANTLQKYV